MTRLLLIGLLLAAGCEDDSGGTIKTDGPGTLDAAADLGPASDAGAEMTPAATARLERPSDLPRPPNGRLPADLFPPIR